MQNMIDNRKEWRMTYVLGDGGKVVCVDNKTGCESITSLPGIPDDILQIRIDKLEYAKASDCDNKPFLQMLFYDKLQLLYVAKSDSPLSYSSIKYSEIAVSFGADSKFKKEKHSDYLGQVTNQSGELYELLTNERRVETKSYYHNYETEEYKGKENLTINLIAGKDLLLSYVIYESRINDNTLFGNRHLQEIEAKAIIKLLPFCSRCHLTVAQRFMISEIS